MRTRNVIVSAALGVSLAAVQTFAGPRTIQAPPTKRGDCQWVHGRFAVYNGGGVQRIWIIGTKRLVYISDDDRVLPPAIVAYEKGGPALGFENALFANFRICALENNTPGHMQRVRVTDVRNPIFLGKPLGAWSAR